MPMQRVSVVGNSGSGKTRLAGELARLLDAPHTELDGLFHLAGWESLAPEDFLVSVHNIVMGDRWVVDGNYRAVVVDGPVWKYADTVIWLDLSRPLVMAQIIRRSLGRVILRKKLWNGNRESMRGLFSWNPEKSVIRWSWTQHAEYQHRYEEAMTSVEYEHLRFIRLKSRREVRALASALQ